jgi:peptidyl-prolyl cis-trans isomerase SurA
LAFALVLWGGLPSQGVSMAQPLERRVSDARAAPSPSRGQGIVVVVNDDPITAYEIEQRAHLLALTANVGEQAKENFQRLVKSPSTEARLRALQQEVISSNPGKSQPELIAIFKERQKQFGISLQKQAIDGARSAMMPKLKKEAQEELIDERLKLQAAKQLGIEVTDADVKALVKGLAERNKMTYQAFVQHVKDMGVDITTMGERFRAQKAWREMVARRWGAQVSVTQRDVDRLLLSAATEAGVDAVELQVQKVSLILAGRMDQAALTKRYAEAEALRHRFAGCRSMAELAKAAPDARFEDMKYVKPSAIGEPMRSMLLAAKDDDVLPPVTTSAGVELYAVCGRRAIAGNDAQRNQAMIELQNKQLEIMAKRQLRNLRQEANIEYR